MYLRNIPKIRYITYSFRRKSRQNRLKAKNCRRYNAAIREGATGRTSIALEGLLSPLLGQVNLSFLSLRYDVEACLTEGMSTRESIPYIQPTSAKYYQRYARNGLIHIKIAYGAIEKLFYGGYDLYHSGHAR